MPELFDIQGLVFSGYRRQPEARYFFLKFEGGSPGPWLASVLNRLTSSEPDQRGDETRLNVAFTASGLRALGLPEQALATFPREFLQGMAHAERSRVLGDLGDDAPERWQFGGRETGFDALVLSYARTEAELEAETELLEDGFDRFELEAHAERVYLPDDAREHFGFVDVRSNPRLSGAPRRAGTSLWRRNRYDPSVPLGEFVLGYRNAYRRVAIGPRAPLRHATRSLPRVTDAGRALDLGRNGSYLALRKLVQDVAGFRRFTEEEGRRLFPREAEQAGARLAAELVGRWPNGEPLARDPALERARRGDLQHFGYREHDAKGVGCPLGAHVRRANPRDSLEGSAQESLAHVRAHRLVRRGRLFGPRLAAGAADDGVERGLMFLAVVANLARQFEFVTQSWLRNPKHAGLFRERDPLVSGGDELADGAGPEQFSIQAEPLALELPIRRFVRVRGGEYLFMPGLKALAYLAET